ncbi:MAG: carbon monoxide dehydrogenase accessory protein CooC [Dehalococcoidales bacterium]|nr:carbon monoxide dehydrogenase accessory protein CooC [Dehalococcoidales bacterium]
MPKLAITGKGGVGKTTLAGLLSRLYAADGHPVLAIDADPDANLASALGFPEELATQIAPIADMKDLIEERTGARPGSMGGVFKLNPHVEDIPDRFCARHNGVGLLQMGTVKKGGGGCVCPENVLLKQLVRHLLVQRSEVVILDMEAGIEHLGRATAQSVDAMIVVVEPGRRSIQTAEAVRELAADIGLFRVFAVGSKVQSNLERDFIREHVGGLPLLGFISYSPLIMEADLRGVSAYDLDPRAVAEAREIRKNMEELLAVEEPARL